MSDHSVSPESQPAIAPPSWWKRTLKFLVLRLVFWYAVICVLVMCMQRQLIYHPETTEKITAAESPLPAGYVHDFSFPTADGLTLNGWHVLRTGTAAPSPDESKKLLKDCDWLVLFLHGNAGDRRGRMDYAQILSGARADVLLIDYRGYADNPGSPSEAGLLEDARGLWKYATEGCGVPAGKIVIFGESLGGGVAVGLAQEICNAGTPPAGLILRSTFSSLADAGSYRYPWLPVRWLLWDRFPSAERIGAVTCPVLNMHGTEDRIVPFALGQKLFAVTPDISANGIPKTFVPLKRADHNDVMLTHEKEVTKAIDDFFAVLTNIRESGNTSE